jgi:polyisoprenoid-binding protein YceI
MIRSLCFAIVLTFLTLPAHSAPVPYKLLTDRSQVQFTYHLSGAATKGTMPVRSADLVIDLADISHSRISVVLSPDGAQAGMFFATEAMKGPSILDTEHYPEARFVSRHIHGTVLEAVVEGDLTIRDVTRPVALQARLYRQEGSEPGDTRVLAVLLTGQIDRTAFGASGYADLVGPVLDLRILAWIARD